MAPRSSHSTSVPQSGRTSRCSGRIRPRSINCWQVGTRRRASSVSNQGIPGEYAKDRDTQSRFSSVVRSGGYDVVLLMEGSNDLGDGFASAAIASLRSMVRDAKSRGVKPFIATIPPMDGSSCCPRRGSAAPLVPGFNDQIRGIASDEGIPLVDVYAALSSSVSQVHQRGWSASQ